jgi:nicotinate-nucleotide adenylyltransferase
VKIGLFGGAFDPPHAGHLALARAAVRELKLDRLFVVPTGRPVWKPSPASPARRLVLARRAFAGLPRVVVSSWETRRTGPSYTFNTLRVFRRRHPGAEWFLVMGGDSWREFTKWRRWRDILKMARLAVGRRAGVSPRGIHPVVRAGSILLKARLPEISSTEIRQSTVENDILKRLRGALTPARFRHTLAVARWAEELARRWGENPDKARLAGLLHDCARDLPGPRQADLVRRRRIPVPHKEFIRRAGRPSLFHAYVSADMARRDFGVKDPAVLSAIRAHTLGAANMSRLARLLYVADFSSTDRKYSEATAVRRLARKDLDRAFAEALRRKLRWASRDGKAVHPVTVRLWNRWRAS